MSRHRLFQHRDIVGISNHDPERGRLINHDPVPTEERFRSFHGRTRYAQLVTKDTSQFADLRLVRRWQALPAMTNQLGMFGLLFFSTSGSGKHRIEP